MDYFKLFAYVSFLFAVITLVGIALHYADLILDPEPQDDAPTGRHL